MWTTGTCSEKADRVNNGLSRRNQKYDLKIETTLTSGDAIDGAQFSDTEAGKHSWAGEIQDDMMTDVVTTAPTQPSLTRANPSAA